MSEFTWLNKQGVRSDQGFEVQFTGRWEMEYREGPHVVHFFVEGGIDPETRQPASSVRVPLGWTIDPQTDDPKTVERRRKILENIARALVFQGLVPFFLDSSNKPYSGGPSAEDE